MTSFSHKAASTLGSSPRLLPDTVGQFSGYASVFNVVDSQGDCIRPGAFTNSLAQWRQKRAWPKLLWQHDSKQPVGTITTLSQDRYGLFMTGSLLLETQQGREAYALLKAGALDGLSIGYQVIQAERPSKNKGKRQLNEVSLWEVSLVTFAANPAAKVTDCKHDAEAALVASLRHTRSLFSPTPSRL